MCVISFCRRAREFWYFYGAWLQWAKWKVFWGVGRRKYDDCQVGEKYMKMIRKLPVSHLLNSFNLRRLRIYFWLPCEITAIYFCVARKKLETAYFLRKVPGKKCIESQLHNVHVKPFLRDCCSVVILSCEREGRNWICSYIQQQMAKISWGRFGRFLQMFSPTCIFIATPMTFFAPHFCEMCPP